MADRARPRRLDARRVSGATVLVLTVLAATLALPSGPLALGAGARPVVPGTAAPAAPSAAPAFPTPIRHVIVIMLENEEAKDVLANGSYERALAQRYAYAGQFYSPMHYSLPNYLAATSGYTSNLFSPVTQVSIGNLALTAGRTWKEYEESMPYACDLSSGITAGGYDPFHNAFALYKPFIHNAPVCAAHMVNFTQLSTDLASGKFPNYAFLVPNVTDDGHNSSLAVADAWLAGFLPGLLNASWFRTTAIFVTYDEGTSNLGPNNSTGGGHVYMTLVSPYARLGYVSNASYTTYSLLTTAEWLLGLGRTGTHDNWTVDPPMKDLFDFPQNVSGFVETSNGAPVANVSVSDHLGASTRTNAYGAFTLKLSPGTYTLYVSPKSGVHGKLTVTVSGSPVSGLVLWVS